MIVYPDLAFVLGILIHGFSYRLMLIATDLSRKKRELFVCILVSGFSCVIILIPRIPLFVPILIGLVSIIVILRGKTVLGTARNCLSGMVIFFIYLGVFLVVSGIFFGISCYFSGSGGYFILSFFRSSMSAVVSYVVLKTVLKARKQRSVLSNCCNCVLTVEGKEIPIRCFVDTGNFLVDPLSGYPVVLVEFQVLKRGIASDFPKPMTFEFAARFSCRARIVPYHSVDGEDQMLSAFVAEKFTVNGRNRNVVIAATPRTLDSRGRFCGIISPDLIGGEE